MSLKVFPSTCIRCKKKLQTGDEIISFGEYQDYHVSCYKETREETLRTVGNYENSFLNHIPGDMEAIRNALSRITVRNSEAFSRIWVDMLALHSDLNIVFSHAKIHNAVGFLEKYRTEGLLKNIYSQIMDIGEKNRNEFEKLKIELAMQERFPSSSRPPIEQIETISKEFQDDIIQDCYEVLKIINEVHENLIIFTRKSITNQKKRIKNEIQDIPKHTTIFKKVPTLIE